MKEIEIQYPTESDFRSQMQEAKVNDGPDMFIAIKSFGQNSPVPNEKTLSIQDKHQCFTF